MERLKRITLLCFLMAIIVWYYYENHQVVIRIPDPSGIDFTLKMPYKDKKRLEFLFKELICYNHFGYTLFGNKSLSLAVYFPPLDFTNWRYFKESIRPCYVKMHLGWKTWLKYEHYFHNPRFKIWSEKNALVNNLAILIADREKMQEVVAENSEDFKTILQKEDISADDLLNQCKNRRFLADVLKEHDGLIGILLGYGRRNSFLFYEKTSSALSSMWKIEDQLPKDNVQNWIFYPYCMVDSESEETKRIKEQFVNSKKRILEYYGKDFNSFLEKTLALFR